MTYKAGFHRQIGNIEMVLKNGDSLTIDDANRITSWTLFWKHDMNWVTGKVSLINTISYGKNVSKLGLDFAPFAHMYCWIFGNSYLLESNHPLKFLSERSYVMHVYLQLQPNNE
jgi:hypothetical protein